MELCPPPHAPNLFFWIKRKPSSRQALENNHGVLTDPRPQPCEQLDQHSLGQVEGLQARAPNSDTRRHLDNV